MSMKRTIARNIVRNRLIDAGYERPNKRMGMTAGGRGQITTAMRQRKGLPNSRMAKRFEKKLREKDPQIWKRVLNGDLSKKFRENSKKVSLKRAIAIQAKRMHRDKARAMQGKKQLPTEDCSGTVEAVIK